MRKEIKREKDSLNKIDHKISAEHESLIQRFKLAKTRLQCIKKVYPKMFWFPLVLKSHADDFQKPSSDELKNAYDRLTRQLNQKSYASLPTAAEKALCSELGLNSKKQIRQNIWIGTHNIDLFIPNLKLSKVCRGLAIEVDGAIHNYESKMKKDEVKGEQLSSLGIAVTHLPNWDHFAKSLAAFKIQYKTLSTLDSRARRRLWTKIYALTLAIHLSDEDFFKIFKPMSNN